MKQLLILLVFVVANLTAHSQNKDAAAIKQVLDKQTRAWNAGNLDSFMVGYWQSDSLLFIGKNGLKYGYETALNNYKKGYSDTIHMGKLHFDILQMKRLSVMYYFIVGRYHLTRSIGDLEGYFTLLFKKIRNKWVIVADQSSSGS